MSDEDILKDGIEIDWSNLVLMPEGRYQVMYISHETTNGSFGAKVKITFTITSNCEFFGKHIDAWYNLKEIKKVGKGKAISLSRHSKLTGELLNALGYKERVKRLSPLALKGKLLWVNIRTVTKNSRQKALHELQRYSVVDSIIGQSDASELTSNTLMPELKVLPVPIPEPIPTIK
jgi:hypothetical protein